MSIHRYEKISISSLLIREIFVCLPSQNIIDCIITVTKKWIYLTYRIYSNKAVHSVFLKTAEKNGVFYGISWPTIKMPQ